MHFILAFLLVTTPGPTLEALGELVRDRADEFHADQWVPPTWHLADGWEILDQHIATQRVIERQRIVNRPVPAGPAIDTNEVIAIVAAGAAVHGWDKGPEWDALAWLINKESGWRPHAQNPRSTAYGLFQFLNGTWSCCGVAKTSDPALQTQAGLIYILHRYGSPSAAVAFHRRNNWY